MKTFVLLVIGVIVGVFIGRCVDYRRAHADEGDRRINCAPNEDNPIFRDSRRISIRMANCIHATMVSRMLLPLPRNLGVELQYEGVLATDHGVPGGPRFEKDVGSVLEWSIMDRSELVLATLTAATKRCAETVAAVNIEGTDVFFTVRFTQRTEPRDSVEFTRTRDELGGRTMQQLLDALQK